MSVHLRGSTPECSVPTAVSFLSQGQRIIPQAPITSFGVPCESPTLANTGPSPLACPVPSCLLVLKGQAPHRYLKRHLKCPGLHGRTGNEKEVLRVNQADYVGIIKLVEVTKAEEERNSRIAEFEVRAKNMGITEEEFVAQKVAIWEGMWVAKQNGDDIRYCAGVLLDAATGGDQYTFFPNCSLRRVEFMYEYSYRSQITEHSRATTGIR
ncbi:hypothetical protein B9Z19DRAFT_1061935 [Tuber borchii]|uniref:Uncharacterized protein n=1 Tax=Tuber borchii TaxID=42251 RepID=A0A2T7A3Q3_TUBBO|nr:hypothetical protein B9Z19DRAFT_1061935 [Tuber borchii]